MAVTHPAGVPVWDAAVIGGGPAGSTAALALASAGARVLILEKESPPRYKTCGGGVVRRAMRRLPPLPAGVIRQECFDAEFHLPAEGMSFTTRRTAPIVIMTMRSELDHSLNTAAVAAGATLRTGCPLEDLRQTETEVELSAGGEIFRAEFVVAADGALGVTAKRAGWSETRGCIPALECEVPHTGNPAFPPGTARFDFGVAPHGYGWIFPKRDGFSIGILSSAPGGINLRSVLNDWLRLLGINTEDGAVTHGFVIPGRPRTDGFSRGRVLCVGDAAGLVDALTGEGITWAAVSGTLAARAILEGGPDPASVGRLYGRFLADSVIPEIRWSRRLASVLYGYPAVRSWLFRKHGQSFCEAMANIVSGDSTYRELLRRPGNYLKLLRQLF